MEEDLDASYEGYLQRQGVRAEAARQKRRRLGMEGELDDDEEDGDGSKDEYEPGSDAEEAEEVRIALQPVALLMYPAVTCLTCICDI